MFVVRSTGGKPSKQRMDLGSTYTPTTSVTQVTGMVADGGFPATHIVSNQIVVDRAGTINVTANLQIGSNSFSTTFTAYVYLNGAQIATGSGTSGGIAMSVSSRAVNANDVLDLRVTVAYGSGVSVAATTTYLEIDPV